MIREKITLATEFCPRVRYFLEEEQVYHLLPVLKSEALRSKDMMVSLGVNKMCARCAMENQGSGCCSKEIEDWYDVPVILLNMLLGVEVPSERGPLNTCIFLGPEGCRLLVRYHFCVNYLCQKIQKRLSMKDLVALKMQYGKELYVAWEIERHIWRYFITHSCRGLL